MDSARFLHTWSNKVDFPIPGSPPTSTNEPGTIPPPSTLSSSANPVWTRLLSCILISDSLLGFNSSPAAPPFFFPAAFFSTDSSTNVLHSPHPGHCPIHFEDSYPQLLQKKTVDVFAILYICTTFTGTSSAFSSSTLKESFPPRFVLIAPMLSPPTNTS